MDVDGINQSKEETSLAPVGDDASSNPTPMTMDKTDAPADDTRLPTTQNESSTAQNASMAFDQDIPTLQSQAIIPQAQVLSTSTYPSSTDSSMPRNPEQMINDYLEDMANEDSIDPPQPFISDLPTGFCYDVRMRYHCELEPPKDRRDYHPEDPRRIFSIYRELCVAGLVDDPVLAKLANAGPLASKPLKQVAVRPVTAAEVQLVHTLKHWEYMKSTAQMTAEMLIDEGYAMDSVYLNGVTFECAKLSAGGAIEVSRAVSCGLVKNAIAIVRPPGHHAECNRPMGFCIFDNVSIAAKVCMADYPESCKKIMIVDWDVHHGNGIQQAFYTDPNVLYISLHVYEGGSFYPGGAYGNHLHSGAGEGLGRNINIPWSKKGMGDADYMYAFQRVVMPVAHDFDPDLVIVAAGFDAAEGDQLGGCFVTPACYAQMTHLLKSVANGRMVACLEGGYNLRSIARSALAVARTLNGETPPRLTDREATSSGINAVEEVVAEQSRYWPCLRPKAPIQESGGSSGHRSQNPLIDGCLGLNQSSQRENMEDVARYYQAATMKERHGMISLSIYRDHLAKSFENQIMATPGFDQETPLLIILHDSPEMMGSPDPVTHKIELRDSWLADGCKQYVDWAIAKGFEVMDVNVPRFVTGTEENKGATEIEDRTSAVDELATYLWDNYIEPNDHTQLVFIGIGTAYQGIMHILNTRPSFYELQPGLINFVPTSPINPATGSPLYPLIPASDQNVYHLSKWYRANSLNFVGREHYIWPREPGAKAPSRRFGNLIRSDANELQDLLESHFGEMKQWILDRCGSDLVGADDDDQEEEKKDKENDVRGDDDEDVVIVNKDYGRDGEAVVLGDEEPS